MSEESFNLALGQVLLAAALADGELETDERRALEDLLFRLPDWDVEDWRRIEAQLDDPASVPDLETASQALRRQTRDEGDAEVARNTVDSLRRRLPEDSVEREALAEVLHLALGDARPDDSPTGLFGRLKAAVADPLRRHVDALRSSDQRQRTLEESFAERVRRDWPADQAAPEGAELHHLCVGAAILGHVVQLDDEVDPGEVDAMREALVRHWGITPTEAQVVTEVALDRTAAGIDLYASMREFFRESDEDERQRFLAAVFHVAAGDGRATAEEIEQIRVIGRGMLLSHQHFIAAKLSLDPEQRDM